MRRTATLLLPVLMLLGTLGCKQEEKKQPEQPRIITFGEPTTSALQHNVPLVKRLSKGWQPAVSRHSKKGHRLYSFHRTRGVSTSFLNVWTRIDYASPQEPESGKWDYAVGEMEISCAAMAYQQGELRLYSFPDGKIVRRVPPLTRMKDVPPDTPMEAFIQAACKHYNPTT